MKVLHITNKPIYPILDGGQLATERMMNCLLHLGYEVKNLSIETHKHPFDINNYPETIQEQTNPEACFIDTRIRMFDVLKSFFSSYSYNVKRFVDDKFSLKIKALLEEDTYELIVLESAYLLPYLKLIRLNSDAKVVVRAHNVEYKIWRQSARKEKFFLKRYYLRKLANNLKQFELTHLNLVDGILCISEQDKEFFKRRGIKAQLIVIPVYMELGENIEVNYASNDFFFIGSMSWKPNQDAVNWILNKIAPRLLKVLPDSKIHIAGSSMPAKMMNHKTRNVVIHGKVKDMKQFMSQHGTLIVPLSTGSGVRIKILEALSNGIPIISTEKGKEGINLTVKEHYLTANLTEEFLLQMKYIDNNEEFKRNMGEASKRFIQEEYSLDIISKRISEFVSSI